MTRDFTVSESGSRMGRKPINAKATQVRLSPDARARIEAIVGPRGMARFIREAAEEKLARLEREAKRPKPQDGPRPAV